MQLIVYLTTIIFLVKLSQAQILSLGMPNGQISNPQRTINVPSNNVVIGGNNAYGIGNALTTLPNVQVARNGPVAGIVNNLNSNLLNANLGNTISLANNNFANGISVGNIGSSIGSNFGVNRNVVNANLPVNLANGFNINTGKFSATNMGLAGLLPANRPCGLQIVADALEVGGAVDVNGQLPFYTTVFVNGVLPSSGTGYVNCNCGGQ